MSLIYLNESEKKTYTYRSTLTFFLLHRQYEPHKQNEPDEHQKRRNR